MKSSENPENPANGSLFPPDKRPLLTKSEYAAHRGVSPSAITRAKNEGRIVVTKINGRELVDVRASDSVWSGLTRQRIDAPGPDSPLQDPLGDLGGVGDELKAVRLRRELVQAELLEIDLDQRCGLLVERSVIEFLIRDLGETIRAKLELLPDLLTPQLARHKGDTAAIRSEIASHMHDLLNQLAEHFRRQADRNLPPILDPNDENPH